MFLFLGFCCAWGACIAKNDFIQKWQQQVLSKKTLWDYETHNATEPYYPTYTSLYVNGLHVASFHDAGTCHSKIRELKQLAERIYDQNTPAQPTQNSGGVNLQGAATKQLLRMAGVSEQEARKQMQGLDNALNKQIDVVENQKKQEHLDKVERLCSCQTEQNPNYNPNANMYGHNNDFFVAINNENTNANNQSFSLSNDNNTQYENILEAPSVRNATFIIESRKPSVSLNFDNISNTSELKVNMDIQKQPDMPVMRSTIESEYEKKQLFAEQEKEKRFNLDSLKSQKETLEAKYDEILKTCNKFSEFDCLNKLNPIADELKIIEEKIQWQEGVSNMSDEVLEAQKRDYQTFEDMAALAWNSYPGKQGESYSAVNVSKYSTDTSWRKDWGFDCTLYKKEDGTYVLAFAGTDECIDGVGSWGQGAITPTLTQSRIALSIIEDVKEKLKQEGVPENELMNRLTLTGHSLGGRLAAETALKNGLTAYTFNSAGVSIETKEWVEKNNKWDKAGKIINIHAGDDWLTNGQETVSGMLGGTTPYVNNSFVKGIAGKVVNNPTFHLVGQDITTVGGQIKIGESTGGHDMGELYNKIVNRKESIQYEISNRNSN